jgi:excinuclease ABC subunit C
MTKRDLSKIKLPMQPGVYLFVGDTKKVLYVGKATSLRDRVRSYFARDLEAVRSAAIAEMVQKAVTVESRETDSVLEALILEAELIKKHKPRYNTFGKDDKSFNHLAITNEDFPRVIAVRGKDLKEQYSKEDIKYSFGPFPSGMMFREAVRLVRKIFPFRDKCSPGSSRPCFNHQIGLCPGVCVGAMGKREYARTIQHIRLFFEGKKKALVRTLEREMKEYAKREEFEHAARLKKTLFALKHIQDVSLIKRDLKDFEKGGRSFRIEAYDVAHMTGANQVGVMVVVECGGAQKSEYRKFKIRSVDKADDTGALGEILTRRLGHANWPLPKLIVTDGGKAQKNTAERTFRKLGFNIEVASVVKDLKHRPREIIGRKGTLDVYRDEILLANSEAHRFAVSFHRSRGRKQALM